MWTWIFVKKFWKFSKKIFYFVLWHSERDFKDPWFKIQSMHVVTEDEKMFQDHNIIWQGSLECLEKEEVENCLISSFINYPWSIWKELNFDLEWRKRELVSLKNCVFISGSKIALQVLKTTLRTQSLWKLLKYCCFVVLQ